MNIRDFLRDHQVEFELIPHRDAFNAQQLAEAIHVPGGQVAKTVLLRADHAYAYIVAVLPADKSVDLQQASVMLGGSELELATEVEIADHCPDCEFGVLPPFGSQYAMKTIVDESLMSNEEIVFEGASHDEAIRLKTDDYRRLEGPLVCDFAR